MHEKGLYRVSFSKSYNKIRENLYFVLVEPESPGNIGATARAMKTCGFKNLILVNPKEKLHPETKWMAHQSEEILENARHVNTLAEAIADMNLVIGTTQRKRYFRFPFYTPDEISDKIEGTALEHPAAIVFGRESTGLTNEELTQCHMHSTIYTATTKPALNLSQAVMIYAYTFFKLQNVKDSKFRLDLASTEEMNHFYNHLQLSLKEIGFVPRDSMDNFITRFKRILGRSMPEKRDVRLLHKLLEVYEKRIGQLENEIKNDSNKIEKSIF
jgi:tRNA (cytidine32/uridine32-2'-O)-methyltransferase